MVHFGTVTSSVKKTGFVGPVQNMYCILRYWNMFIVASPSMQFQKGLNIYANV